MQTFDHTNSENLDKYNDRIYKVIEIEYDTDTGLYEQKQCLNGNAKKAKVKGKHKCRLLITFSRKYMEYQRYIRNRQIERAKTLLGKDIDKIKKGPHDIKRFIMRDKSQNAGEKKAKDTYVLDEEKIKEEEKYDGFYAIATNLEIASLEDAYKVFNINSNRYKIEDCFRVLKTNFQARPVYHHIPSRIKAHFLTCYTALLIYRILERKIAEKGKHYTIKEIITTLQCMNVENMGDMYYKACYTGSTVLKTLEDIFDLGIDRLYYEPALIHKIVRDIL